MILNSDKEARLLVDIVEKCRMNDPSQRPTAEDIYYILKSRNIRNLGNLESKINQFRKEILEEKERYDILDYYVSLNAVAANNISNQKTFDLYTYINNDFLEKQKDNKLLLLNSTSGGGKTTFLFFLEKLYLEKWKSRNDGFPILIKLSTINKDKQTKLIFTFLEKKGFLSSEIDKLLKTTKILLLLDGFDELQTPYNIYVENNFEKYENLYVIITCRSNSEIIENGDYLKYFMCKNAQFIDIEIAPFNDNQIENCIKAYIEKIANSQNISQEQMKHIVNGIRTKNNMNSPFLI